jgi:hypothetical protein
MVDFSFLKQHSTVDNLKSAVDELQKYASYQDTRFWRPELDKAGNGYAVIRLLPAPKVDLEKDEKAQAFIRRFRHQFKNDRGEHYIENCLTTLGKRDPVADLCKILYNTGDEGDKKLASLYKRKVNYISNIQVIEYPTKKEDEGKLFLYSYGAKLWAKVEGALEPKSARQKKFNPFDFFEGANLVLNIKTIGGYPNYDDSVFEAPSPLFDNEADAIALWEKEYSLLEFLDPKNFDTYENLKAKLDAVLDDTFEHRGSAAGKLSGSRPPAIANKSPAAKIAAPVSTQKGDDTPPWDASEDADIKYFQNLVATAE